MRPCNHCQKFTAVYLKRTRTSGNSTKGPTSTSNHEGKKQEVQGMGQAPDSNCHLLFFLKLLGLDKFRDFLRFLGRTSIRTILLQGPVQGLGPLPSSLRRGVVEATGNIEHDELFLDGRQPAATPHSHTAELKCTCASRHAFAHPRTTAVWQHPRGFFWPTKRSQVLRAGQRLKRNSSKERATVAAPQKGHVGRFVETTAAGEAEPPLKCTSYSLHPPPSH